MRVSEALRAGHARLITDGWGQGGYEDEDGRPCPVGALRKVPHISHRVLVDAVTLLNRVATGSEDWYLTQWNDHEDRTIDEVLDVYRAAIQIAEDEERKQEQIPSTRYDLGEQIGVEDHASAISTL